MSLWIGNYRLFCMIQDDSMINSAFNNDRHPDVYKELRTSIIKDQKNYPQIFYAWIVRKFKKNKKSLLLKAFTIKWQGWRESNSHQRFWRPLFYHWTTPLKKWWLVRDSNSWMTPWKGAVLSHFTNEPFFRLLCNNSINHLWFQQKNKNEDKFFVFCELKKWTVICEKF